MTISSSTRTAGPFLGDGSTTALPFGFKVFATTDVLVQRTSADGAQLALTLGGDYTVALNADQNAAPGGVVTLLDPAADFPTGSSITLTSAVAATQPLSLANGGPFLAKSIEDALDRLTLLLQQQALSLDGAVRAPLVEALTELPSAASRSGRMLAFNASTGDVEVPAFTTTQVLNAIAAAYSAAAVLPFLNVVAYGALGNSSSDDTASLQAACDIGGTIMAPPGGFRTTATINLTVPGTIIKGAGRNATMILADFRGGPVFKISAARCDIQDLAVSSLAGSARRLASPFGKTAPDASVDGNSLDYGVLFQEDASPMTFSRLTRLEITNQPADGVVWYGEGACTVLDQVNITNCGGHGTYWDEGGRAGLSLGRPGIVDMKNCLIQLCWGHGVALATEGSNTCYRFNLINCEIYNNCHGDGGTNQPAFYSSLEAAVAGRCQNFHMELGAVGVSDVGLLLGNTTVARVVGTRYISCTSWGSYINPGCSRVHITMPFYDPDPTVGIRVRETCDNVVVDGLLDGDLTTPIDAESEVRVVMNNKVHFTVPGSNALWQAEGLAAATIAAGTCDIRSRTVRIIGEGDVIDTVSQFRFAAGIAVPDGYRFTVCNFNAYNITISDISGGGSANIQVQGSNAVLEPGESLDFIPYSGVYYAVGREIP